MLRGEQPEQAPAHERGQMIILLALALVALIAFVGLATDAGLLYLERGRLQRAIDASALAAANQLPDTGAAERAAYEFARLNGYGFEPDSDPLAIAFPLTDPPRKIAVVTGTVEVDLAFLPIIGLHTAAVTAHGSGESLPLDVYLALDLSSSMWYDTRMPAGWSYDLCSDSGCRDCGIDWFWWHFRERAWQNCRSYYCNYARACDPLDVHVKPAVDHFVSQLDARYERLGVVSYDIQALQAIPLTNDYNAVRTAVESLDAYRVDAPSTNIGDAILSADHYLSLPPPEQGGEGGRRDSLWSIVLLTDDVPTCYREGNDPQGDLHCVPAVCSSCENYAYTNAQRSWDNHQITIYTICYGERCANNRHYQDVTIRIADITDNGVVDGTTENFWLAPDEASLRQALEEITERIFTRLLE